MGGWLGRTGEEGAVEGGRGEGGSVTGGWVGKKGTGAREGRGW